MSLFETPRRTLIVVAAALLLALLVLLARPSQLPVARELLTQEAMWSVPVPVTVESETALSAIYQRRLWGAPQLPGQPPGAPTEEKPLTAPDWRVAGVYSEGGQGVVLISVEGQPLPQHLRVGDQLPGGARIMSISSERLHLTLAGRRASLSTYPQ